jgi:uncharacterized membrane protein
MSQPSFASPTRRIPHLAIAAVLLGVALSAFFDGILLHQILQWHHLLSLANGATWRDLHNQILADGLFHAGVYLVMVSGLWALWRARSGLSILGAGRKLRADILIGFGLWNVVDIVGFHWIAGLHRVRVDVPDPLRWDLAWLLVLGAVPVLAGFWMRQRDGGSGPSRKTAPLVSLVVVLAGAGAMLPAATQRAAFVAFRPHVSSSQAIKVVAAANARIVDVSPSGRSMIVVLPDNEARWSLYRGGALVVGGGGLAGCGTFS